MEDVCETLSDRVETLIEGHKNLLLSTDGTSGASKRSSNGSRVLRKPFARSRSKSKSKQTCPSTLNPA